MLSGKDAQEVNRHYSMKIAHLEQEADHAKKELAETQKQLQELESREVQDGTQIARLQREFRKKVDTAKLKVQVGSIYKSPSHLVCITYYLCNSLLFKTFACYICEIFLIN